MPSVLYTYEKLAVADRASFQGFYKLFVDSMPESERKAESAIAEMVRRPEYNILLLKDAENIIGYSVLFSPSGELFHLLEYMAIKADYRNQGLGQALFTRTFLGLASSTSEPAYVLLEVDSELEESADHQLRKRRQQFYRRLGCLRVKHLAYQLPLETDVSPPAMDILIYPLKGFHAITKAQLKHWLNTIYVNVYGKQSDDPRIGQMLALVADPIELQ